MKLIFKLPDKRKEFVNAQKSIDSNCMKFLNEFVPIASTVLSGSGFGQHVNVCAEDSVYSDLVPLIYLIKYIIKF